MIEHEEADMPVIVCHPPALTWWEGNAETIRCPGCGHAADLDGWDVIGADEGCLFCSQCSLEVSV